MERRGPPQGLRFDNRQGEFDRSTDQFDNGGANKFDQGATPIKSWSQPGVGVYGRFGGGPPVNVHPSTNTSRYVRSRLAANYGTRVPSFGVGIEESHAGAA